MPVCKNNAIAQGVYIYRMINARNQAFTMSFGPAETSLAANMDATPARVNTPPNTQTFVKPLAPRI